MLNVWRRGPLTRNPYHETAFKTLGLPPEATRAEIDQRAGERQAAVAAVPDRYRLGERFLTAADVTQARAVLLDPTRRLIEELLEHTTEILPREELERALARLPVPDWTAESPGPHSLAFLGCAAQDLALDFLRGLPLTEPPPFPVDARLVPPFGVDDD
jgi:DNA-binding transcriptional ArsR family regulator